MDAVAKLIASIAQLLWPLFGFWLLFLFRMEISNILRRLSHATKVKAPGIDIELDQLEESTVKAIRELPPPTALLPQRSVTRLGTIEAGPAVVESAESRILHEVTKSPKAALLILGSEIQKQVRQILAATNWQQNIKPEPLLEAVDKLRAQGSLPEHVTASLKLFLDVRSKLVHGEASEDEVFRAIDSGLTLLRAISSIPAEVNVVYQPNVAIYSDAACTKLITDAHGVLLETTSSDGSQKFYRVFPTTRTHFQKGKRVAWEWDMARVWGPAWYHDTNGNEAKQAWTSSAEFVGRHLDEI